jgi:large subunit ribosomal protein L17
MRSLARSLVLHGSIRTTEAKAKSLRPFVEKLVTKSRTGTLHSLRQITVELGPKAGKMLIEDIGKRYEGRPGGYTRIVKDGTRRAGAAPMARIAFV